MRAAMRSGARGDALACCGCGAEPRLPNQRYCRNCRNEAQKKYRLKRREELWSLRKGAKDKAGAQ
jgi:uncharacterized OB-fold protein